MSEKISGALCAGEFGSQLPLFGDTAILHDAPVAPLLVIGRARFDAQKYFNNALSAHPLC
jgi:hypothetical protein